MMGADAWTFELIGIYIEFKKEAMHKQYSIASFLSFLSVVSKTAAKGNTFSEMNLGGGGGGGAEFGRYLVASPIFLDWMWECFSKINK